MLSSKTNDVTLFSNGIGHFRRTYDISSGEETRISIPFKTDCIGDVAASLQVFGNVRLNSPPSFTPANSNATALRIDQSEALKSLIRQLSGAQIMLELRNISPDEYTLLGLDTESTVLNGEEVCKDFLIAMRNGAVRRFPLSDVNDIRFEDESVRTEIDKALKANFQMIKPDSTLLDLVLSPIGEEATEAEVQYTIPVAAWKMRYAIREEDGTFSIDGAAIIDNNTDEDWINFKVSVVTGNPISFNTDIADVIVPKRRMVHLVDRLTLGNVDVEEGTIMAQAATVMDPESFIPRNESRSMRNMSTANVASFGMELVDDDMAQHASGTGSLDAAEAPGVESEDVGDFCVFSCKEPITILARKSAVVPMFLVPLKHAGVVLLYKESSHARRPFRAIKFKNETEYSLGRGKTVIYNQGLFSGECVLDATKPGENRMLPHCLENGVKIVKAKSESTSRRSSIHISDGAAVIEQVRTGLTEYVIENKKDESFKVALEHTNRVPGDNTMVEFSGIEIKEREKLDHGWRVYFEIKSNQKTTLTVTESHLVQQTTILKNHFNWIVTNIIDVENPIADDPQIQACVKIQGRIDEANREIHEARSRIDELDQQVDRVRQNLEAAQNVASGGKLGKWIDDLDTSEEEIRKINKKTVPQLNNKLKSLSDELGEALQKVSASWKEKETETKK